MREVTTFSIMRLLIGVAAFLQALDSYGILSSTFADHTMRTPYVEWLPALSPDWLIAFTGLWCAASVAFAAGWHYRIAGVVLMAVMAYAILVDQQGYSNHVYLLILVVGLLSIAESPDGWPATLLRYQLSIVYFFAAISKVNLLYISGAIIGANLRNGWLIPLPEPLDRWEVFLPVATTSIMLELFLAFALWSPRYRRDGLIIGIVFHVMIVLTFPAAYAVELIVFGLTMLALYTLFTDPVEATERIRARLSTATLTRRLGTLSTRR